MDTAAPDAIHLHRRSATLELVFATGSYTLDAEFLRVHSPSAEVRGHGRGQEVLQTGKRGIGIESLSQVGNYGLKLIFDDGHDTGIYSWFYLHDLAVNRDRLWRDYLERLEAAGASRTPLPAGTEAITIRPPPGD